MNGIKPYNLLFMAACLLLSPGFTLHSYGQKKEKIRILNANSMQYNRQLGEVRRLIGDVRLVHENTYLNCDSAWLYQKANMVEAYGNIFISRGDTLKLYGDYLKYSGETKMAELKNNVKLIDKETTLTTRNLDFDLNSDLGYYYGGGHIINGEDDLTSINGIYDSKQKLFHFQDSVVVVNPDYVIHADTMQYQTETKITTFFGPTEITGDSSYIYCEYGWFDTENDISRFSGNAVLIDRNQIIQGDSLFYDKGAGIGEAYGNVIYKDTTQNIVLLGNVGYFQRKPEYSMLTDSAVFVQIMEGDDSLFLHADTLVSGLDSTGTTKIMSAYHGVRLYSEGLQGMSDSLSYSFSDSVIRFYGSPVIWASDSQMTSDYILLRTKNRKADMMEMYGSSFIVTMEDSVHFNQIKGKNMVGYFKDNEMYRIDVTGNGQTIYFPVEDSTIIGQNYAESSDIVLYIKENRINRIKLINAPDGILNPTSKIRDEDTRLEGFLWREYLRPKKYADIFKD